MFLLSGNACKILVKHQCGISAIYKVKQNAVFWGGSAPSFSMIWFPCLFLEVPYWSLCGAFAIIYHLFTKGFSLIYLWLFTGQRIEENMYFQIKLSVDIISPLSEGAVLAAMMRKAFTSNLLVEEFSHSSSKNPKHLWDLTSSPCVSVQTEQDDSQLRH